MRGIIRAAYAATPGKSFLFKALRVVAEPPPGVYRHLHFRGVFTTRVDGGSFRMRHHGYELENAVFWGGVEGYEPESMRPWRRLAARSKCILDVGANTGLYALVAQAVNPAAAVIAFEPVERVYAKLTENAALNGGRIICERLALSDRDGTAVIYDTDDEHTNSVTVGENRALPGVRTHEVTIPVSRMDSYMRGRFPDLVKIDVEKHEAHVIAGMGQLLTARPALLVEVLRDEIGRRIDALTSGLGYETRHLDERNRLYVTAEQSRWL